MSAGTDIPLTGKSPTVESPVSELAARLQIDHGGVIVSCTESLASLLNCRVGDLVGHSLESIASFRSRNNGQLIRDFLARLFAEQDGEGWAQVPDANICFPAGENYPLSIQRIGASDDRVATIELSFSLDDEPKVQISDDLTLLKATSLMAQVGGWDLEPATGNLRWTDQTFRIHGLEPGDTPRLKDALSFYLAEDRPLLESAIQEALLQGLPYDLELRLMTAKGRLRNVRTICYPSVSGDNTVRLIGTIQDITEQSEVKTALSESESRYRDLFENNSAIKLLIDPQSLKIIEANSAAVEFYGYSAEEFQKLKISDLNVLEETEVVAAVEAVNEHRTQELEFTHRLSSGETRDVKVHTGTITLNQVNLIYSIIFDITEQKRAQEAVIRMQQLESLGTLAGGIAHDFNNVLTAIFGNLSLATHILAKDHQAQKYLRNAEQAMERATGLSKQLLTFAKGGTPVPQNVDFSELIANVIHFDLTGSNVRPVFAIDTDLWDLHVDPTQLQQVFSNLTLNADQAMREGGILRVAATNVILKANELPEVESGKFVKVTFHDTGCGIDQNALPRIFEPYFSTKPTGNGLGLATSYSIVQKHNGHIEAASFPGEGTTFTIHLPATESVQPEGRDCELPFDSPRQLIRRALILDDEVMILELLSGMLSTLGASSETCQTTNSVVQAYRREFEAGTPFDVVILDLTIPGGPGGQEAANRILQIDPDAVLLCTTGYTEDRIMVDSADYGCRGAIPKPYKLDELRTVMSMLEPRRSARTSSDGNQEVRPQR